MTGKTHLVGGTVFGLLFLKVTNTPLDSASATMVIVSSVAALMPDIDMSESLGSKMVYPISFVWNKAREISKKNKFEYLGDMFEHRGLTHTLLFPLIFLGLYYYTKGEIFLYSMIGWLSHMFLDINNDRGIPLFWPATRKRFHILTISTGGAKTKKGPKKINVENIVYALLWVITAIFIVERYFNKSV